MSGHASLLPRVGQYAAFPLRLLSRIYRKGLRDTVRRVEFLAHTWWCERRLGIDTSGFIPWHLLGSNPCSVDYEAVGYRTLHRAFAAISIAAEDVFVDYGCGKGRPLVVASTYPFRQVIGVEQSTQLAQIARQNLQRASGKRVCSDVEVQVADALEWELPPKANKIFLFNPFTGDVLHQVIARIESSLRRHPRELTVIYVQPRQADDAFASCDWLHRAEDIESEGLRLRIYISASVAAR